MEETKEFDFDEAIGYFYKPLSPEEKITLKDIITHIHLDVVYMILKKLPPIFIIDLCRNISVGVAMLYPFPSRSPERFGKKKDPSEEKIPTYEDKIEMICTNIQFRKEYFKLWKIGSRSTMKEYLGYPKEYYRILSFFCRQDYVEDYYKDFVSLLSEEIVEGRINWEVVKQIPKDNSTDDYLGRLGKDVLGSQPFEGRAAFYAYLKNRLQEYKDTGLGRQFFDWDEKQLRRGWKP